MERFISVCRNPLAKSATTKAIGYATQVPNASAKLLLFSDMAMGWSGLRAVLVRIACNQPLVTPVTAVTSVTPRVFIF